MSTPPLAHLRRGPGRARKTETPRTGLTAVPPDESDNEGRDAPASRTAVSRLLELTQTAQYLGISAWTVRDLKANGTLQRVSIPLAGGRELRKLLFDRVRIPEEADRSFRTNLITRSGPS